MSDKQKYSEYLEKKKNDKISEQRMNFFESFQKAAKDGEAKALSGVNETSIENFIRSFDRSLVELQKAFDFLSDYVLFIRKETPGQKKTADVIDRYCLNRFEKTSREAVTGRKKTVVPIPDNAVIEPRHLGILTNGQFVSAFRELRRSVVSMYDDVERSPFEWGYPDFYITDGYYNRVTDFLFAFAACGVCEDGTVTVETKSFMNYPAIKKHKKPELMVSGFKKMGYNIEEFDKNSIAFRVSYPACPDVMPVLCAYVRELGDSLLHWSAGEMMKWSLSYRYIEAHAAQKYETVFHAKMDVSSDELKDIQYWLHEEADKYGYKIDISHPYEKGCIQYKKGSKVFLLIGEKEINGANTVFSKAIFRDVFVSENNKIMRLYGRFPDAFKSNCTLCGESKPADSKCSMRICYDIDGKPHRNCSYLSFCFYPLDPKAAKEILELFLIENKQNK